MIIPFNHHPLVGKIAKLTDFGLILEKEYYQILNIVSPLTFQSLLSYCQLKNHKNEISLIFLDEPPVQYKGLTLYCLKEIGKNCAGDWHWFTLNQLMICDE